MAGFSMVFFIGHSGGFGGIDGMSGPEVAIFLGEGNRQWLEAHYIHGSEQANRLGKIKSIVPIGPYYRDALLDASIAYYSSHFRHCPSFDIVRQQLGDVDFLDFNMGQKDIPAAWPALREEARPAFESLTIYSAELNLLTGQDLSAGHVYGSVPSTSYD